MNPNNKTNFSTTQQIFTHYNDDFLARYGNINPNINNIKKNLSQSCMDCSLDTEPTERTRLLEETAIEAKLKKVLNNGTISKKNPLILNEKELSIIRNSLKNADIIKKENENLTIRKMPEISENDFNKMRNEITSDKDLKELYEHLKTINCYFKNNYRDYIGSIFPLTYLIESNYHFDEKKEKEIYKKYNNFKNYISNFRTVCGDGNCFYRAVMFRYIEILILNKNADYLKRVIFDMKNSFDSDILKNHEMILENKVKPDLTYKLMFIILKLVSNNQINEAHQIFYKSINTCRKFDYSLILYIRYILYVYIKDNENKNYLESFPIKIGNLLPAKYETSNGEFLFKDFYENFLLRFYTDAEKITIYLTPFILGIELNIILLEDEEDEIIKKFVWVGSSEVKTKDTISLINRKYHYEIIYNKEDNESNKELFEIYKTDEKSLIIDKIEQNLLQESSILEKVEKTNNKLNNNKKNKVININEIDINIDDNNKNCVNTMMNNSKSFYNNLNTYQNKKLNENNDKKSYYPLIEDIAVKSNICNTQIFNNESNLKKSLYNLNNNNNKNIININNINDFQKDYPKNDQVGFITPGNDDKCTICKNNCANTICDICSKCLYNEMFNQSYSLYIDFIQKNMGKNKFKIPDNFSINGKSYKSKDLFNEYNRVSNDKKNIFCENKLIRIFQKKICIFCINDINNKPKLDLPCGCCLCIQEIDIFFIGKKQFNEQKHFICVCGEEYSRFQILQLGISLEKLNSVLSIKNKIINYLNMRLASLCCVCGNMRKENIKYVKIIIQNSTLSCIENSVEIRRFLSYLNHYICHKCSLSANPMSPFKCIVCNVDHDCMSIESFWY